MTPIDGTLASELVSVSPQLAVVLFFPIMLSLLKFLGTVNQYLIILLQWITGVMLFIIDHHNWCTK